MPHQFRYRVLIGQLDSMIRYSSRCEAREAAKKISNLTQYRIQVRDLDLDDEVVAEYREGAVEYRKVST